MTKPRAEGRACNTPAVTTINGAIPPIASSATGGRACQTSTRSYRATRESTVHERVARPARHSFRCSNHDSRKVEAAILPDRHQAIVARVTLTSRKAEPAIPGRRSLQHPVGAACDRAHMPSWILKFARPHGRRSLQCLKIAEGGDCNGSVWPSPSSGFTGGGDCIDARAVGGACDPFAAKPRIPARDSDLARPVSFPYISSSFFVANVEVVSLALLGKKEWPHSRPCLVFPSPSVRAYALTAPHLTADGPNGPSQRVEQSARTERTSQRHLQAENPSRLLGEGVLFGNLSGPPKP